MTIAPGPSAYHEILRRISAEVWITSADAYAHAPGAITLPDVEPDQSLPLDIASPSCPEALQQNLSQFIYAYYYFGDPVEARNAQRKDATPPPIVLREDRAFGAALRQANQGKGYADPGWRVTETSGDIAIVTKNRLSLLARPGDVIAWPEPLGVGAEITLRFPKDRPYTYPGYYMAVGDGGPATAELRRPIARIYLDIRPEGAADLVAAITGSMGAALTRLSVKVLNNPRAYTRSDAAVVYLLRDEYPRARGMLRDVVSALRHHVGERIPAFVCPLARGVGVAEEPPAEGAARLSFGQHRCTLIARGLARAFDVDVSDARGRLRHVLRELATAGVDASRPYLNPGATDIYTSLDDIGTPAYLAREASSAPAFTSDGE